MRGKRPGFRSWFESAPEDEKCDGCDGEMPISQGDDTMVMVTPDWQELHFCMRCVFAIDVKIRHSKTGSCIDIERGSLKMSLLSNAFRKRWRRMMQAMCAYRASGDDGAYKAEIKAFCDDMGISNAYQYLLACGEPSSREAENRRKKDHERYLRRKEEKMRKKKDELAQMAASLSELRQRVAGKAAELAAHFLAAKVAHMNGDNTKYQEEHGASAAILLELQRMGDSVKEGREQKSEMISGL